MEDKEIHFEVCVNCQAHSWCTHHDEKKYLGLFSEMKAALALEAKIPNLKCVMNKYTPQPSTGAFEITFKQIIIYSKKETGLFPSTGPTCDRVVQFLDDYTNHKDTTKYAKMKEKKYEPPRKVKEKPTFESYKKMKEEEDRKKQQQLQQQQPQEEAKAEDGAAEEEAKSPGQQSPQNKQPQEQPTENTPTKQDPPQQTPTEQPPAEQQQPPSDPPAQQQEPPAEQPKNEEPGADPQP